MIRVTIELLPRGSEVRKKHLGTIEISNDGRHGVGPVGDYNVLLSKRGSRQLWRSGRVEGFPRLRLGAYDLLFRALSATVGFRNPNTATCPPTHDEQEAA